MKKLLLICVLLSSASFMFSQTADGPSGSGTELAPYQIATWQNLYWISQNSTEWDKYYEQTANIDLADADPAISTWDSNQGWTPIGNSGTKFTGSYDGQEYSISNIYIYRSSSNYIGLFGSILSSASITDLSLTNVDITGDEQVGGLVGRAESSVISGCSVSGTVTGTRWTGGMGGIIKSTNINYCSAENIVVNGGYYAGGLAGLLENYTHANCSSTGTVNATTGNAGGLAGDLNSVTLSNSYSSCAVISSGSTAGGFAGYIYGTSAISRCYATGNVTTSGNIQCGGFVGKAYNSNFYNCYARGSASGSDRVGGFIGERSSSYIYRSYSTGAVSGSSSYGGFVGYISGGGIYNSFWNVYTDNLTGTSSGQNNSGATGKTTTEMKTLATFTDAGWDFKGIGEEGIWNIGNERNDDYPYLDWQYSEDVPLPITLASFTGVVLNGQVQLSWHTASETENLAFRIYRDEELLAELEGAGTTSEPQNYLWTDNYVIPGRTYTYVLADVDLRGKETRHPGTEVEVKVEPDIDKDFNICPAYPNPFNPVTVVPLNLAKDAHVHAQLYNMLGRSVQELHKGILNVGSHTLKVDGSALGTGIYFVHVNVNNALHVQKIALMK